jgi:hypothetical protein
MRKKTIIINCRECGGTGVHYQEKMDGHGLLCLECLGSGSQTISFTPFKGRLAIANVCTVTARKKYGPSGEMVTYDEFAKGKIPAFDD